MAVCVCVWNLIILQCQKINRNEWFKWRKKKSIPNSNLNRIFEPNEERREKDKKKEYETHTLLTNWHTKIRLILQSTFDKQATPPGA